MSPQFVSFLLLSFLVSSSTVQGIIIQNRKASSSSRLSKIDQPITRSDVVHEHATFLMTSMMMMLLTTRSDISRAEEDLIIPPSILPCKPRKDGTYSNCVSTSSVKQVDCYIAPWTYECSLNDAQSCLRKVFSQDPLVFSNIYETTGYIRVDAARGLVTDELEFRFQDQEKVVTIRSAEKASSSTISDFGANRRRLDNIRKDAKVFGVMGGAFDSIETRGTGPLGQLKAFYGLQSGEGYQDLYNN
jgi:uncharacterized protein (DUF1499 family)